MAEHSKVIAITGASGGIGAATARLLAQRGHRVVLGARRRDRLEALKESLQAAGAEVDVAVTDVRQRGDHIRLAELAQSRFGRLDVWIGNAGIGPVSALDDLRVEDWDGMVAVNLSGLLYGIATALPIFRAQDSGQFVHVISTAAYRTVPGQAVYAATKAAARTLTDGLRQEAGPTIRVAMVSPGFVNTDFVDSVPDDQVRADMTARRDELALDPAAVAHAIAYAIEQPADVDVNELVIRSTAQK